MTPRLLVTVDTEEEGAYSGRFSPTGHTVENLRGVPRFQALCDRYGVRPTYFVDAPVVDSALGVEILKPIADGGRCEIGAHVHPWCNPPLEETCSRHNSYLCNLPLDLQRRKIAWLTERIAARFGGRPTSFRAGRYGLDGRGARLLAEQGYTIDSSVIPFTNYGNEGGPDFRHAPWRPYWVDGDDLCQPSPSGFLLEAPISVGFSRPNFASAARWHARAMRAPWRQLKGMGIVNRLGVARRIKFCPEQADGRALIQLIEAFLAQGCDVLVLMFHSSSLVPGLSPYVCDAGALERFYVALEEAIRHALVRRGGHTLTLSELAAEWRKPVAAGR